jgi:16S rRNA (adenine1518-N6/adenine1519-N6)-dimethyltransferase
MARLRTAARAAMTALLTPSSARGILEAHGLATRKRDGQNLLVDPNTVRRIVAAARLDPSDVVLEVGPGIGSLTLALAEAVDRIVAVEIDAGFVTALADVLAGLDGVEVVHADALAVDLPALVGGGPARLVANLPYNVATPIVIETLASGAFTDAFVMVQREVGERWAAMPGDPAYSGVSAKLGVLADVSIVLHIPRAVFLPVPNVDSVMVRLTRRPDAPDPVHYARIASVIDAAFAQRRKTLRNTLRALAPSERLIDAAALAGIELSGRAEEVAPDGFVRLSDALVHSDVVAGMDRAPRP